MTFEDGRETTKTDGTYDGTFDEAITTIAGSPVIVNKRDD
jgi:hypothetical protein